MEKVTQHGVESSQAYKDRYIILAIVLLGIVMSVIDGIVVSIALPTITTYFNVDVSLSQWTITGYLLTMTSLLLIFGRLSEYFGKVNFFILGISIFTLSSLACGLATGLWMLIGFRILQGFGAAMVFSISGAILFQAFPENERGKAMGFLGSAVAIGSIAGPVLGGLLVDILGWEYIFLINVPIGIVLVGLALKYLKVGEYKSQTLDFDAPGSALLVIFMASLMLFLGDLGNNVAITAMSLLTAAVAGGSLIAFVYWEAHYGKPLLDLSIFKIKKFMMPLLSMMLSFIPVFMLSIVGPFYFQGVLHYSPSQVGFLYLVTPAVMIVAAPIAGWLYDRTRSRYYATIGMLIAAVSYIAFGLLVSNFSILLAVIVFVISGLGGSLFQSPNNTEMMNSLPPTKIGLSSSVSSTARNLGMALGVSIAAILVTFQLSGAGYSGPILDAGTILMPVVSNVMYVAGAFCTAAAIATLLKNT